MRTAFIRTLTDLARDDERIFLVVGDLGYSVVEPFAQEFPDRFINSGVAEQDMTGIAAGLALCGKIVFTYSIGNFATMRCLEQIRNDICYHKANVKIVTVGGGLAYGALGVTHHATEDMAVMRALPSMTVIAPGDPVEAALATRAIAERPEPSYLRLGKAGEPIIHKETPDFQIGRAITVREGNAITMISIGGILDNTLEAAAELAKQGVKARVLSMHTLKPLDAEAVLTAAQETGIIMTIEEHSIVGGLGSAVAEVLAELGVSCTVFKRLGTGDSFCSRIGSQEYLREGYSLSVDGIVKTVQALLRRKHENKFSC